MPQEPASRPPARSVPEPPPTGTPEHEEWLIDVGAEQTFPASDPPSTMDPGNTLSLNNAVRRNHDAPSSSDNDA
jgi:hypothetical protein